jgi:hypothetical protein
MTATSTPNQKTLPLFVAASASGERDGREQGRTISLLTGSNKYKKYKKQIIMLKNIKNKKNEWWVVDVKNKKNEW